MPCVVCEGIKPADPDAPKCSSCGGTGSHELTSCPRQAVPPDIFQLAHLASFADKGHLPVAGGVLNQSLSFLQGLAQLREDDAMWKSERLKRDTPNV